MNSILIKFPFSSINDEAYELNLYASNDSDDFSAAIAAMQADKRCFHYLETLTIPMIIGGNNVVDVYEGTLAGDVASEDNDREDVFVPLVESKLKFNMVCQQFPTWLMDICDYATNVKMMLVVKYGQIRIERWRGYLMANTLNMTVVDEMMACPMVAVDEVGISKYLRFKETYPVNLDGSHPTLFQLFERFWKTNCHSVHPASSRFDDLSDIIGVTMRNTLFVARDLTYPDSADNIIYDLLGLTVNLERWFIDRDATWGDVFADICSYLGVTFYMGSRDTGGNDCYMLSDIDYNYSGYLTYTFGSTGYNHAFNRMFADFGNQVKVGADFNASYKPCEWKGVKVLSTPERPPVHEYLGKDNVKAIEPAVGHAEWCETQIGKKRGNTTLDDYKWRVFQYTRIVDREGQWIAEDQYIRMEQCVLSAIGVYLGGQGYFPYNNGGQGNVRPQPEDVDSLDFALTKVGMITARLGTYETPRQKVSANLSDFFVILNNNWGRLYWDGDTVVDSGYLGDAVIATFFPFANDASLRPNDEAYLTIDFAAMFLNENIGDDIRILANGDQQNDLHGTIQSVFPMEESMYNWEAGPAGPGDAAKFTGDLTSTATNIVNQFQPVIKARLSIGDFYWNGSYWQHVTGGAEPPTFDLGLTPTGATEKYWMISTGYMHGEVKNYYYEECRPRVGASDNVFRVPLGGLSVHGQPLEGKARLELFGPVNFVNGYKPSLSATTRWNNILFVLISDVRIEITDKAYYSEEDITTKAEKYTDADSTTKKTKEVELKMSTPTVEGFFNNCLLYDNGKSWVNLQRVLRSGGGNHTPEEIKASEMAAVFGGDRVTVEFSREFDGINTDNIYNVGFTVRNLTEVAGKFMPLTRKFNWTKGLVRWKLQKVAD